MVSGVPHAKKKAHLIRSVYWRIGTRPRSKSSGVFLFIKTKQKTALNGRSFLFAFLRNRAFFLKLSPQCFVSVFTASLLNLGKR